MISINKLVNLTFKNIEIVDSNNDTIVILFAWKGEAVRLENDSRQVVRFGSFSSDSIAVPVAIPEAFPTVKWPEGLPNDVDAIIVEDEIAHRLSQRNIPRGLWVFGVDRSKETFIEENDYEVKTRNLVLRVSVI